MCVCLCVCVCVWGGGDIDDAASEETDSCQSQYRHMLSHMLSAFLLITDDDLSLSAEDFT